MITKKIKSKNGGFIALISAVIISVLLLTITLTVSLTGFFGRFNVLDSESKERSIALAEACVDMAVLEYSTDGVMTEESKVVDDESCDVHDASESGGILTIVATGEFNSAFTNIKAVIDTSDMSISSWDECPTTSLSPCP
jgi:hypothetical protein